MAENKPPKAPTPSCCGYPNKIANTQTQTTRGTDNQTKGRGFSKNSN